MFKLLQKLDAHFVGLEAGQTDIKPKIRVILDRQTELENSLSSLGLRWISIEKDSLKLHSEI